MILIPYEHVENFTRLGCNSVWIQKLAVYADFAYIENLEIVLCVVLGSFVCSIEIILQLM